MTISLAFEILVSLLLIITIGYCFALDQRLKALRNGQDGVQQSIIQLLQATKQAEHSVLVLSKTGETITQELEARIVEAKTLSRTLSNANTYKPAPKPSGQTARRRAIPIPKTPVETSPLMDRLKRAG